jgi:monofunctional biosynthetic peptidoglycan transglycosylase
MTIDVFKNSHTGPSGRFGISPTGTTIFGIAAGLLIIMHVTAIGEEHVKTLLDFTHTDEDSNWIAVNDVVMGGVSSSSLAIADDSTAVFSGTVSLENYGGFASVRTHPRDFGLGGYTGIRIRVRGDGKRYQFRLRAGEELDGIAYRMDFETEPDAWLEIDLPFDRFVATFRGRVLKDIGSPEPDKIRQIGFLIADKQVGDFSLQIEWIKAYQ